MSDSKLTAHLKIFRPANIVTAIADIWAGIAIAGGTVGLFYAIDETMLSQLLWLTVSTVGLYGGGVAFNDVFDAELDAIERPERPIPSGKVSRGTAAWLASALLLVGIIAAGQVSMISALIALVVALLAVLYDYWGKHQLIFGPINMGLCRTGNLLLGISIVPGMLEKYWYLGMIPLIYVAAITMISRGEVHGKNRNALLGGLIMYLLILLALLGLALSINDNGWQALPFLALFGFMILPPLLKAIKEQLPQLIGKAVKAGVISLIVLNACISAVFAGWEFGLMVLLLLPLSLWLARKYAVT